MVMAEVHTHFLDTAASPNHAMRGYADTVRRRLLDGVEALVRARAHA
jgi:hypothetical protein